MKLSKVEQVRNKGTKQTQTMQDHMSLCRTFICVAWFGLKYFLHNMYVAFALMLNGDMCCV